MRTIHACIIAALLWLAPTLAPAQGFTDQATYAGAGAGTANAQTATVSNAFTLGDLQGVIIRYIPANANTGATTLAVSGLTATSVLKDSPTGLVALVGNELTPTVAAYVMYDGTQFQLLNPQGHAVHAGGLGNSSLSFNTPPNLTIAAAVAAGGLTVTVETAAGGAPTVGSPVPVVFRDATITGGDPVIVPVTTTLSIAIASGNTVGCVTTQLCRLWVVLANNAGTPALCVWNAVAWPASAGAAVSIAGIDEGALQSSASGTTGGSSALTYYCSASSLSNVAVRIIGYIEATETSGVWGSVSRVQLFGPGIKKPGDVVQEKFAPAASLAISPRSICNLVLVAAKENLTVAAGASQTATLLRTATVIDTTAANNGSPTGSMTFSVQLGPILDAPATVSSTTYSISNTGGTPANQIFHLVEIQG